MTIGADDLSETFDKLNRRIRASLDAVHQAREVALPECRRAIRSSSLAIRSVHLGRVAAFDEQIAEARDALRVAQTALAPFPEIAAVGFLHDAEKEVAEAHLTAALVAGDPLMGFEELGLRLPAWLNGLAEAASELRRSVLDRLRTGDVETGERLFTSMEAAYDMLSTVDFPDAITGGLRRTVDALRAVVERTRSDITTTVIQQKLQRALENKAR